MKPAQPFPFAFLLVPCLLWISPGLISPGLGAQAPVTKAQDAAKTSKTAPADLLARWAPAIVTIKVVLKTSFVGGGSSQDSESNAELHGVVVDPSGLVMTSNAAFTPPDFGAHQAGDFRMQITPRDFKVIFEKDEKEYPAFLAATETKLGLAFVQTLQLGEKEVTAVDFSSSATDAAVGDPVVTVCRLGKGFDHAAYFRTTTIAGQIRKPRKAWILDRIPAPDGHPVFDSRGTILGAMVKISSGIKSDESRGGFGIMISSLGSGTDAAPQNFLLPAQVVSRVVKQAKGQAAKRLAEKDDKKQK